MKFVLISFLIGFIIKINLINALPIFGEIYYEKKIANNHLAKKYCDSLEKNLFFHSLVTKVLYLFFRRLFAQNKLLPEENVRILYFYLLKLLTIKIIFLKRQEQTS